MVDTQTLTHPPTHACVPTHSCCVQVVKRRRAAEGCSHIPPTEAGEAAGVVVVVVVVVVVTTTSRSRRKAMTLPRQAEGEGEAGIGDLTALCRGTVEDGVPMCEGQVVVGEGPAAGGLRSSRAKGATGSGMESPAWDGEEDTLQGRRAQGRATRPPLSPTSPRRPWMRGCRSASPPVGSPHLHYRVVQVQVGARVGGGLEAEPLVGVVVVSRREPLSRGN